MPKRMVLGTGPENPPIVFVGAAPGDTEVRLREPFTGSAGRLLRRVAGNAKICPIDVYSTYVIKERPAIGLDAIIKFKKNGVVVTAQYNTYERFLIDELKELNPKLVVAFGDVALYALCRIQGIEKYRGSLLRSVTVPGLWVLACDDPESAQKQPPITRLMHYDLSFAADLLAADEITYEKRTLILAPTFSVASDWLLSVDPNKPLAFDIELTNEEVSHISFAQDEYEAISIQFYSHGVATFSTEQERDLMVLIAKLFADENILKIVHNTTFDLNFLYEKYRMLISPTWDTIIAQAIMYPDLKRNLGLVTSIYTDVPYYKDEGKTRFQHGVVTTESYISTYLEYLQLYKYNNADNFDAYSALDALVLPEIYNGQLKQLSVSGNGVAVHRHMKVIEPIIFMVQRGIRVDKEKMKKRSEDYAGQIQMLQVELNNLAGRPLNANSPAQLKDYFYREKGIRPHMRGGKPSTEESVMVQLGAKGYAEAGLIVNTRKLRKLKSTYLDAKLDDDGRLRYGLNPIGGKFGRFSSKKDIFERGMNVQNIPPTIKQYLLPDIGYIAYELDLSQAESRVVAYVGNETAMTKVFETGQDVHSLTAGLLFSKDPEEVRSLHKEWIAAGQPADKRYCPPLAGYKFDFRSWGKRANHSLNYDIGPRAAGILWECTEADAKTVVRKYKQIYSGVARYQEYIRTFLREKGYLENLFQRRYPLILMHPNDIKKGYSYMAQSTVADLINLAGVVPAYEHPRVELLAQIHDSIIIQISKEHSSAQHISALKDLTSSMERKLKTQAGQEFSIPTDVKVFTENFRDGKEFSSSDLDSPAFLSEIQHASNAT